MNWPCKRVEATEQVQALLQQEHDSCRTVKLWAMASCGVYSPPLLFMGGAAIYLSPRTAPNDKQMQLSSTHLQQGGGQGEGEQTQGTCAFRSQGARL